MPFHQPTPAITIQQYVNSKQNNRYIQSKTNQKQITNRMLIKTQAQSIVLNIEEIKRCMKHVRHVNFKTQQQSIK